MLSGKSRHNSPGSVGGSPFLSCNPSPSKRLSSSPVIFSGSLMDSSSVLAPLLSGVGARASQILISSPQGSQLNTHRATQARGGWSPSNGLFTPECSSSCPTAQHFQNAPAPTTPTRPATQSMTSNKERKIGCKYFHACVLGVKPIWTAKTQSFITHMHQAHASTQQTVSANQHGLLHWLQESSRWMCAVCCKSFSTSRKAPCPCGLHSSEPTILGIVLVPQEVAPVEIQEFSPIEITGVHPEDDAAEVAAQWATSLKNMLMAYVPTVEFLYKKVRTKWTRLFKLCLDETNHAPHDQDAWTRLLLFSKATLFLPPNLKDAGSMTHLILTRMDRWERGEWKSLLEECHAASTSYSTEPTPVSIGTQNLRNRIRCLHLARLGRFGDATKALQSLGVV